MKRPRNINRMRRLLEEREIDEDTRAFERCGAESPLVRDDDYDSSSRHAMEDFSIALSRIIK